MLNASDARCRRSLVEMVDKFFQCVLRTLGFAFDLQDASFIEAQLQSKYKNTYRAINSVLDVACDADSLCLFDCEIS
jgi:hypothetical protein